MNNVDKIIDLIKRACEDIEHTDITISGLSPEYELLGQEICLCLNQIKEAYLFASKMADGDFDTIAPPRENYMAAPLKDLYFKLKHLIWQTNQVAKGDYNQKVDFLGSFSESFNYMTYELKKRKLLLHKHAEERIHRIETMNRRLQTQIECQLFHYESYHNYIKSFKEFRQKYQEMMGQVYALFDEGKYEEGRILIAKINDLMGSEVIIQKNYSNNDFINAALINISSLCYNRNIPFSGRIHIPEDTKIDRKINMNLITQLTELLISLIGNEKQAEQSLTIRSIKKCNWLSIVVKYFTTTNKFPPQDCLDYKERIKQLRDLSESIDAIFNIEYKKELQLVDIIFHINLEG